MNNQVETGKSENPRGAARFRTSVQGQRLARAAALVIAFVIALPLSAHVFGNEAKPGAEDGTHQGIRAASIIDAADSEATLAKLEELAEAVSPDLPEYFGREVGLPAGAQDVRSDVAGKVVGCVVPGSAPEVLERVSAAMATAGWSEVGLAGVEGATFVKASGECPWALVTCTQVGESTSVVYRCVTR